MPAVYANGGGGGFGGTLGNGCDHHGCRRRPICNIAFIPGNAFNDIVAMYLDTKSGGFVDADMRDHADGGRTAISELHSTSDNDLIRTGSVARFGFAIGEFRLGAV